MEYLYDEDSVAGFKYLNKVYFYRKNIQGDISAIYDIDGKLEVCYTYDAWGNHVIKDEHGTEIYNSATGVAVGYENHIGNINPFRYRGYYYDVETHLYYLQTRYYDPEVGRFITIDDISYLDPETINGLNLYAYCGNNPVMNVDPSGKAFLSFVIAGLVIGSLIGAGTSILSQSLSNSGIANVNVGQVVLDAIIGGVGGAIAMSGLSLGTMVAIGGGLGFVSAFGGAVLKEENLSCGETWLDIGVSTAIGAIGGLIGGKGINVKYQLGRIYTVTIKKETAISVTRIAKYNSIIKNATKNIVDGLLLFIAASIFSAGSHIGYSFK